MTLLEKAQKADTLYRKDFCRDCLTVLIEMGPEAIAMHLKAGAKLPEKQLHHLASACGFVVVTASGDPYFGGLVTNFKKEWDELFDILLPIEIDPNLN